MKQFKSFATLLLACVALPATAQSERLCTAGQNSVFGWYDLGDGHVGTLEPGTGTCSSATVLKARLGTLDLPLADAVVHDVSAGTVALPLLEPSLCADYFGTPGDAAWSLAIKDANGDEMIAALGGVSSLGYATATGLLTPAMVASYGSTAWMRCHSGLASNPVIPADVVGEDPEEAVFPFGDGFESPVVVPPGPDLQVAFLDMQGNLLDEDEIPQGPAQDVQFQVRIKNIGTTQAHDVRVLEFVPTSAALLMPTVTRVGCVDVDNANVACSDAAPNSNGIGTRRLVQYVGPLDVGDARTFALTRRSSNTTDFSENQPMALIQVAAFSDPGLSGPDMDLLNNSRTLRIKAVDQITVTRAITTNGIQGGAGGTLVRTSVPSGCSPEAGAVTTCPPATQGLVYSASAASGYTFTGFTGCAGTTSGVDETAGTLTTTGAGSCTVTANFRSMPTVTTSAGAHGAISPASQLVHYNTSAQFNVTPDVGYAVDVISGCGGATHVSANTWQTAAVVADCTVTVSFKVPQFTVTATALGNGSVTPESATAQYGQPVSFTVAPAGSEYDVVVTGTCPSLPGAWFGNSYMVPNITQDCQVQFEFVLITYPVTVASGLVNGSISLADGGIVEHGQSASFTVSPDVGYHLDGSVTGTSACGTISMTGNAGTAGPITSAGCELSANFAINQYTVTVSVATGSGLNGTIAPMGISSGDVEPVVIGPVDHGNSAEVWVFPEAGYYASFPLNPACWFAPVGDDVPSGAKKFRVASVTDNCNVEVQFLQQ